MALFKPFRGNRASLNNKELHDGYAYFCTDDGTFHIDYADDDGNLHRKQINAKEAEELVGYDIATSLNSSDVEIPTSKTIKTYVDNAVANAGSNIELDTMLTQSGKAADAKAVGDALAGKANTSDIPTKVSDLTNDSGFITGYTETDPTVPAWAKATTKPSYNLGEVSDTTSYVRMTHDERTKLSGIATGAEVNVQADWSVTDDTSDAFIKNKPTLGSLAAKSKVAKADLEDGVQTSLGKADTALQSFTETDPTVPSWAKASTKPTYTKSEVGLGNVDNVKQYSASNPPPYPVTKVNNKTGAITLSASDVGADASGTASSAVSAHNTNTSAHADIRTAINGKANKAEGTFFIEGSGTTDSTNKVSTWTGTSDRITEYYDGLTLRYKIGVAGQSTTTLNINGLGAKTVYRFGETKLTTQFPVGSIIHLIYHGDLNDGCWMCSDYDSNTNTQQRVYSSTNNVEYPITTRYNTTTGSSYYAEYGRYSTGVTLNPSTNTITATKFKGALTGNADTATKATQDGGGNVITSTYETKTEGTTKITTHNADTSAHADIRQAISQLSYNDLRDKPSIPSISISGKTLIIKS